MEIKKKYGRIVAKAWSDESFKSALLNDPAGVLRENGIEFPDTVTVRVVENTGNTVHMVLPRPPAEELTDEQLDAAAGGVNYPCIGDTRCCVVE